MTKLFGFLFCSVLEPGALAHGAARIHNRHSVLRQKVTQCETKGVHHGCFNTNIVSYDFYDLGTPQIIGNLVIRWMEEILHQLIDSKHPINSNCTVYI